jgi:threonine dehydrogenase-like Zn-dependent dehydrogenase
MKAVVKTQGGPGHIEIKDVPIPEIGDDDVLMEVKAAGLCGSDVGFVDVGAVGILNPPVILGHEFAGLVSKVGKNVKAWKPGDRVVSDNTGTVCGSCYACATADFLACPQRLGLGYGMDGGFAKYVKILGDTLKVFPGSLIKIPDDMSFDEASLMDPACNSYRAVIQEGKLMPGEDVVVFGVGALGQFAIQAARVGGAARIIAIGLKSDKERFEIAKINGATDFIYADETDPVAKVKEITEGEGVALAIDCAGTNIIISQAIDMVRITGTIVRIGYDIRPFEYSLDDLVNRAVRLIGHFGYDWVCWRNVIKLWKAKKLSLDSIITHRMKLSQFSEGIEMLKKQEAVKIVLYPED